MSLATGTLNPLCPSCGMHHPVPRSCHNCACVNALRNFAADLEFRLGAAMKRAKQRHEEAKVLPKPTGKPRLLRRRK